MKNLIQALLFATGVALFIFCFRLGFFKTDTYAFLIWNLFLAWIPFLFALLVARIAHDKSWRWFTWILIGSWLLFFPNAPYILTDLGHLARVTEWPTIPLGFDVVMLLIFALNGLMLGFVSLFMIEDVWRNWFGNKIAVAMSYGVLLLSGFAMYLGRFLRWNSWDVAHRPFDIMSDIAQRLIEPWMHPMTWGFSLLYAGMLMAIYTTIFILRKNRS